MSEREGRRLVLEVDGGARGNPGPAAFGVVVRDPDSGDVLARAAEPIGIATNNVAEYEGLIAGLRLAREVDPSAALEVRMDSRLVIEQMAGRWKIKHADMRRLAQRARELAPESITWTWVPRESNAAADALLNAVLDGGAPVRWITPRVRRDQPATARPDQAMAADVRESPGRAETLGGVTTVLLLRHGETERDQAGRLAGREGGAVPLTERGRAQAASAASAIARRGRAAVVVTSPLQPARETAEVVATALGLPVRVEPELAEVSFGAWGGRAVAEVRQRWPEEWAAWRSSSAAAPPGGESLDSALTRVRGVHERLLASYAGQTVVVVTHTVLVGLLICQALGVPPHVVHRLDVAPGSWSEVRWYDAERASLRTFGATGV